MHIPYIVISFIFVIGATSLYGGRWYQNKQFYRQYQESQEQRKEVLNNYGFEEVEVQKVSLKPDAKIGSFLNNRNLKIPKKSIEIIKHYYPYRQKAYLDEENKWRVGYGRFKNVSPSVNIDQQTAERLLNNDLQEIGEVIKETVNTQLSNNEYGAMISYFYTNGIIDKKDIQKSKVIELIKKNEKKEAALFILNDETQSSNQSKDLAKRAKDLRTQEYFIFTSSFE